MDTVSVEILKGNYGMHCVSVTGKCAIGLKGFIFFNHSRNFQLNVL